MHLGKELQIRAEQLEILFAPTVFVACAHLLAATLMVYMLWDQTAVSHGELIFCAVSISVMVFARLFLFFAYRRKHLVPSQVDIWVKWFFVASIALGLTWACSEIWIFPRLDTSDQLVMVLIVGGISALATITLSPMRNTFITFVLIMLVPMILMLFFEGYREAFGVALLLTVMATGFIAGAGRCRNNIIQNIASRIESHEREAALQKLSSAIEQTGEAIVITDREGIIEYVNPAFTQLTGYNADEVIGQSTRLLKSGNQDASFYKEMWETITSGKPWYGKIINRKKDGSTYPAMVTISPISSTPDNAARYSHFVATQYDLSRLEDVERQLFQSQKMEAIGTLAGGIAHDFNNMLAGMTGYLYLAKAHSNENHEVIEKLDNVENIAFRAADMIQQLLTFARKDMVTIKQMYLNAFIKETFKLLRMSVPENIELHQHICNEVLQINGDPTQLHQVLINLINNARDAVEGQDAPVITIRLEAWHPDEAFMDSHPHFDDKPYAHLSVEDNGRGIAEHQIEHIFEPFFTTKEQGKGTGLGLSMTFGAIKTHHGFVEVESVEGRGTTIHLYIPLLPQAEELVEVPVQEKEISSGHGELILLVDDDPGIIKTGKKVLESLGYQVLTAADGNEAISLFQKYPGQIDLCILDVVMPVMGGDKAAQVIRQIDPHTKIIFSTGYDRSLLDGMEEETIFAKPYRIKEMSSLIRKQLDS